MSYATERALRAMELLAFSACTAPQLAAALQIHQRTARRLLRKLVDEQYVTETRRHCRAAPVYALSPRLIGLAAQAIDRLPLVTVAEPLLAELHATLGIPVFIATPSYRHVLVLVSHGGPPNRWDLLPAHASAAGKLLLAHRPAWRQAITSDALIGHTPATLTSPAELDEQAERILARGFAAETGEHFPDRDAVAVPIATNDQQPIAALAAVTSANPSRGRPSPPVIRALGVTAKSIHHRQHMALRQPAAAQ
jgi:DNA-binding IclR family transcriptional regulator